MEKRRWIRRKWEEKQNQGNARITRTGFAMKARKE